MNLPMRAPQIFPALLLASLFILAGQRAFPFSWSQTELHHIFPQEHTDWFNMKGINPDLWCIPLSREKHTGAGNSVHHHKYRTSGGRNYNDSWVYFIRSNPEASEAECFLFAAKLFSEVGINLSKTKFFNYRTGVLSKVKIPKSKYLDRAWPVIDKLCRYAGKVGQYAGPFVMFYDLMEIMTDDEIPVDRAKYIKALDAFIQAKEFYEDGEYRKSRIQSMMYCYYIGSLAFDFYEYGSGFTIDFRKMRVIENNEYLFREADEIALEYLLKANEIRKKLNYEFPEIQLELGKFYRLNKKDNLAKNYLWEARNGFRAQGNIAMAKEAGKLLDEID